MRRGRGLGPPSRRLLLPYLLAGSPPPRPPGPQASRASRPYWLLREYGLEVGKDFFEVDTGGPVTGFNGTRDR